MKVVVLAYHNIGCEGINALLRNGFDIAAVFTHKDDQSENVWFNSVAKLAASKNIPVFAPISSRMGLSITCPFSSFPGFGSPLYGFTVLTRTRL